MRVVERDEQGLPLREPSEQRDQSRAERSRVGRPPTRLLDEQRDSQRAALRIRELRDRVVGRLQQVPEPRERQIALGLGAARDEHEQASVVRALDGRPPERRLADAGIAFDDEYAAAAAVEKCAELGDLALPPEQPALAAVLHVPEDDTGV